MHSSTCTLAGWQSPLHSAALFHTLLSAKKIPILGQKRQENVLGCLGALGEGKGVRRELGDRMEVPGMWCFLITISRASQSIRLCA